QRANAFAAIWEMRSHHRTIALAQLDRWQAQQMVGKLAGRHTLTKEVIDGVTERAGGVSLFVEEVTRCLLEREAQGGVQAIPPTLQTIPNSGARPARVGTRSGADWCCDRTRLFLRGAAGCSSNGGRATTVGAEPARGC